MTRRPSLTWLSLVFAPVVLLTGCVVEDAPESGSPAPIVAPPTCFSEDPGCGCQLGTEPVSCVHTEEVGDRVICEGGAMYCVDGVWSECETVETWEVPRPKLIQTPGECSPCEPDCYISNDEPGATDLNIPNITSSTNVEFVTGPPRGLRPIPMITGGTGSVDTDGDGVPDAADDCPAVAGMARFFGCTTGVGSGGFFHVLPPGATAQDPLSFDVQLNDVDVYFLIDTTLSMLDEINNLRSSLTSGTLTPGCTGGVIGAIRCRMPGAQFGVGQFEDMPNGYGDDGAYGSYTGSGSYPGSTLPFVNRVDITTNQAAAQSAINALQLHTGGPSDYPESQSTALYSIATGSGITFWSDTHLAPRTNCPAGRWGFPCFRSNAVPMVFVVTDAEWHNGPNASNDYHDQAVPFVEPGWPTNNTVQNIGDVTSSFRRFSGTTNNSGINNLINTHGSCTSSSRRERLVQFTVSTTRTVTMDLSNSSFDTVLYLYSGAGADAGDLLECDSDDGAGSTSRIVRSLTPGTYTLRIDGNGANGNFVLDIGVPNLPSGAPTYAQTLAALQTRGVYVLGVTTSGTGGGAPRSDLDNASVATGAVNGSTGATFNQSISTNGSGLSGVVVNAIYNLANSVRMHVDVVAENINLLPGVPASALIQSVAVGGGCPGSCTGALPTGCASCLPGSDLPFTVTFRNNVIPQTAMDQVFNFSLIVRANLGEQELMRVPVRIVVPGMMATTTYSTATFSRTFDPDTDETCQIPPTRPDWGMFTWNVTTPGDSSVVFHFRTAETLAELDTVMAQTSYAVPAGPDVPTAAQQINIGDRITLMGGQNFLPYMRVTAVLNPSTDGTLAPTLTSMGLQYGCVDSE